MIRRVFFPLLLILCIAHLFNACAAPANYLAYQSQNFCAELRGTLNGIEFGAQIDIKTINTPKSPPENTEDRLENYEIEIRYLSPKELKGILVSVKYDPSTGTLLTTAQLGEISVNIPKERIRGWLRPAEVLLSLSRNTLKSVQKNQTGFLLSFEEGISLTVDPSGRPLSLQSDDISFSVVWFQTEK